MHNKAFAYIYIYMCVCVYTHTHTHTHIYLSIYVRMYVLYVWTRYSGRRRRQRINNPRRARKAERFSQPYKSSVLCRHKMPFLNAHAHAQRTSTLIPWKRASVYNANAYVAHGYIRMVVEYRLNIFTQPSSHTYVYTYEAQSGS